jgi:hypothetical protein
MTKRATNRPQKGARPLVIEGRQWFYMVTNFAYTIVVWEPEAGQDSVMVDGKAKGEKHVINGKDFFHVSPDDLWQADWKGSAYSVTPRTITNHIRTKFLGLDPMPPAPVEVVEPEPTTRVECKRCGVRYNHPDEICGDCAMEDHEHLANHKTDLVAIIVDAVWSEVRAHAQDKLADDLHEDACKAIADIFQRRRSPT